MPVIGTAIAGWLTGAGVAVGVAGAIGGIVANILTSVAVSALASALAPDAPQPVDPGVQTKVTLSGGVNPRSFIMGRYATAGDFAMPPMSRGWVESTSTPNNLLTLIYILSDKAGVTLTDRIVLDGKYVPITGTVHPSHGNELGGKYAGKAWIRVKNGPTVADSTLTGFFSGRIKRPFTNDMVGRGLTYAILTIRYDVKIWQRVPPAILFEVDGIKLYDPRKDSTVGGSGAQRWNNEATWEQTNNPAVMAYNVYRGITFENGAVWGYKLPDTALPLSNWFAAMNKCDETVALAAGGTERRFRAGFEVSVDMEPATVIEELCKAMAARPVEVGGQFKLIMGYGAMPVLFVTDDDILIDREQVYTPHPGLNDTYNVVRAVYPSPGAMWESADAPTRKDADAITAAQGRELAADLSFAAVPFRLQVQRLMRGALRDHQRMARHAIALPASAAILEPGDNISWTSTRNGYTAKLFTVSGVEDDWRSLSQALSLREVNPNDYDWSTSDEISEDDLDGEDIVTPAQSVPGFAAAPSTITDANSTARRPSITLTWIGADLDDVTGVEYQLRVAGATEVIAQGVFADVPLGSAVISEGVISGVTYEVRTRLVATGREVDWSAWESVSADVVYLGGEDVLIPDIPQNLVLNGRFKYGDLRHWYNADAAISLVPISAIPAGLQATAYTTHVLQSTFVVGSQHIESNIFDVDTDDKIECVYHIASSTAGTFFLNAILELYDADGVNFGSQIVSRTGLPIDTVWRRSRVKFGPIDPAAVQARIKLQFINQVTAGARLFCNRIKAVRKSVKRDYDWRQAPFTLTNTYQTIALVQNTDDEEAAGNDSKVFFTCTARFDPPVGATQMVLDLELLHPDGSTTIYLYTAKNFDGAGVNNIFVPVAFNRVLPGALTLPETVRVRARRQASGYDIDILDASLIVESVKD